MRIPFNYAYYTGKELDYIKEAIEKRDIAGNGRFTQLCQQWLEKNLNSPKALLTTSGTAALEMAALLLDIQPGDEIIMPSYTFSSTANAFVLRGGVPVFIDIRPDNLNIDETLLENAITPKTRAIVVVHYAGVACEMDTIMAIANKHNLPVVEDAAQGIHSFYKDRPLGSIGALSALSFHGTKNIICGEGGALLINDKQYFDRSDYLWEKGTNRKKFFEGMMDKYTWVDLGSSFLPSEVLAAMLYAQLEEIEKITAKRLTIWNSYHSAFSTLEYDQLITRPTIPCECKHNAHLYFLLCKNLKQRIALGNALKTADIVAPIHYVPLHSAPAGQRFGRTHGNLDYTNMLSASLIRLPLWPELTPQDQQYIIDHVFQFFKGNLHNDE